MRGGERPGPRGRRALCGLLLALVAVAPVAAQAHNGHPRVPTRYSLANHCWTINPVGGAYVAKDSGGYVAGARRGKAERFYLKPTQLGMYLVYDRARGFMGAGDGASVETATAPSPATEWIVRRAGRRLTLINRDTRGSLRVGPGKRLQQGGGAGATRFAFKRARGCRNYPEVQVNARGMPFNGRTSYTEVVGTIDPHLHISAYEFLGGGVHCGRPFHRYGAPYALVDCPDHGPGGQTAIFENVTYEESVGGHDTVGWPTFRDWPHPQSQTHEQTYYRWIERAWKAGTRIIVNDLVENEVLCRVYPFGKRYPQCNDMFSVRLQARRMREMQNYIDAQEGGPGKGWFRIVRTPFQARRVINQGKLAVVLGVEVSRVFGCGFKNNVPQCDRADVDRGLDLIERLGVASLFPIHKFDNGFGGVRFDSGPTGVAINNANKEETGQYWQIETCQGPLHDNEQDTAVPGPGSDILSQGFFALLPPGLLPVYPPPPHCNIRGLTELGRYLIEEMIDREIMIELDHMGVRTSTAALAIAEARRYSGVLATHTWSDPLTFRRIYRLGGFATPITEVAPEFIKEWRFMRRVRAKRFVFGVGFGADSNGLHTQPVARGSEGHVTYPFRSIDGRVRFRRQRSGRRVYDVNRDGVAHYGLHADWFEDLEDVAGRRISRDLFRGAEAYLQTWERAVGVPGPRCLPAPRRFSHRGLGRMKIGMRANRVLRRVGQPRRRVNRSYRWCVDVKRKDPGARAVAVFTRRGRLGLVASTARGHRIRGIGPNRPQGNVTRQFQSLGGGLYVKRRRNGLPTRVYGVRRGRIAFTGLAAPRVASSRASLRRFLRLGGIR